MKICITAEKDTLESPVDPRFGRCQYFVFVDVDTHAFEAVQNPNVSGMGGVGIQSAQMMNEKGVTAVLTGNVGPNAFQTLRAAGVSVFTGVTGTIADAVEKFKSGQLQPVDNPSVDSKFGSAQ